MHRQPLLKLLGDYRRLWPPEEAPTVDLLERFVRSTPDCFERSHLEGHVTGSALVTDPTFTRVLLTLHRKLGRWLQLGGHSDGDPRTDVVALTEAREESGIHDLRFVHYAGTATPLPFDVDVHRIPERPGVPEHFHYDVRYLLVAPEGAEPVRSDESRDLRWLTLEEARRLTDEESMLRQFAKLEGLRPPSGPPRS